LVVLKHYNGQVRFGTFWVVMQCFGLLRGLESSVMTKIRSFESKRKHWRKNKKIALENALIYNDLGVEVFSKNSALRLNLLAMVELFWYICSLFLLMNLLQCKSATQQKFNSHS